MPGFLPGQLDGASRVAHGLSNWYVLSALAVPRGLSSTFVLARADRFPVELCLAAGIGASWVVQWVVFFGQVCFGLTLNCPLEWRLAAGIGAPRVVRSFLLFSLFHGVVFSVCVFL